MFYKNWRANSTVTLFLCVEGLCTYGLLASTELGSSAVSWVQELLKLHRCFPQAPVFEHLVSSSVLGSGIQEVVSLGVIAWPNFLLSLPLLLHP